MHKKDKGIGFLYKNLSYRRKFIRTLWVTLIGILVSIYALLMSADKYFVCILIVGFAVVDFRQLRDTYTKWKSEKTEPRTI